MLQRGSGLLQCTAGRHQLCRHFLPRCHQRHAGGDRPRDTPRRSPPPRPASLRPARGAAVPRQSCSGPRRGAGRICRGAAGGPPFVPDVKHIGQPSSASASSQGLVMASTFGPQTISGSKPSARRYAAPAAPICSKILPLSCDKKVRVRRQCVRAAALVFLYFSDPAPPRQRHPAGLRHAVKGGLSLVGQPAGAAVQTDHERVTR